MRNKGSAYVVIVLLVISSIALGGCSVDTAPLLPSDASEDLSRVSFDVHLQRSSLTNREFESYKMLPAGIFTECGVIHRGRPET